MDEGEPGLGFSSEVLNDIQQPRIQYVPDGDISRPFGGLIYTPARCRHDTLDNGSRGRRMATERVSGLLVDSAGLLGVDFASLMVPF
jgi:hypothetical protein